MSKIRRKNRYFFSFFKIMFFMLLLGVFITASNQVFANVTLDEMNALLKQREAAAAEKNRSALSFANQHSKLQSKNQSKVYNALGSNYAFVYFYRASCPHCVRFSPILKQYSEDADIRVNAFAINGETSSVFPASKIVTSQIASEYFGSSRINVPVLFIINKVNLHVYEVSSGELSYVELADRMHELTPKILKIDAEQP